MRSRQMTVLVGALAVLVLVATSWAGGHEAKKPPKVGILLVAFGTSAPQAQVAFDNIDRKVKHAFPDVAVRWAYTSAIIRAKLAKAGQNLDSPEVALAKMLDEGFTHVAVQSLHTIAGAEFHDLLAAAHAFEFNGGFERILVGNALLATQQDMARAVDGVLGTIPPERRPGEAVVLMGHGTHHPANAFYAALMFQLQRRDPLVFVGCVEGYPEIDEIKAMLIEQKIKKAYLMPFMSVAGDHAMNDMAGDEPDSWKSVLSQAGITCVPILKGTAEYDSFVEIWVDHLRGALNHF